MTGGGRGIGRGHCLHLAAQGAGVVVNDVDGAEAQKVVDEITAAGGKAVANSDDIGTREGAQALIGACVDEFGGDPRAGEQRRQREGPLLPQDERRRLRRACCASTCSGTFMCAQEAAFRMRDQGTGGSIVNTVSAAHFGNFGQTNYAGSKGAIASMTYTWARELARYGIRVNAISPAGTTRMSATAKIGGKTVDLPFIDPTLNGPFVAWLCSDDASWVTGQIFGSGARPRRDRRAAALRHRHVQAGRLVGGRPAASR